MGNACVKRDKDGLTPGTNPGTARPPEKRPSVTPTPGEHETPNPLENLSPEEREALLEEYKKRFLVISSSIIIFFKDKSQLPKAVRKRWNHSR